MPIDYDLLLIFSFVTLTTLIVVGGVLLFPLSKQLGRYLSGLADAGPPLGRAQAEQLKAQVEELADQVAQLEERQRFMESLVEGDQEKKALGSPGDGP